MALLSVFAGATLALAKILIGLAANSAAVVSDGFEAAADVVSSAIVFTGLWLASKPPDRDHPYGHGRYETLASLCVSAILAITGFIICWHSSYQWVAQRCKTLCHLPIAGGHRLKGDSRHPEVSDRAADIEFGARSRCLARL